MGDLTANFSASEFDVNEAVPSQYYDNRDAVATMLQSFRDMISSPIVVTSCYRDSSRNTDVGGATDSQHLTASAADVKFPLVSQYAVATALLAAEQNGGAPQYSQCIFYTDSDHAHIGLPDSSLASGQKLVHYSDGSYQVLSTSNIGDLPSLPSDPLFDTNDDQPAPSPANVSPFGWVTFGTLFGIGILYLFVKLGSKRSR
jgi:Peptidase M15